MLANLAIVLFRPKLSDNVGATARAMANMGCEDLYVVAPRDFDLGRARALATPRGWPVLDRMVIADDLAKVLAPFEIVYGTTARTGGWRRAGQLTPETAAVRAVERMREGGRVAFLFGPEDQGLTNEETLVCSRLVTIPTSEEASSLNLSQAALIVLYEVLKAWRAGAGPPESPAEAAGGASGGQAGNPSGETMTGSPSEGVTLAAELGRPASHKEREALYEKLREALLAIDFIKEDNADYWMLPVRNFVERAKLRRSDFNMLMGVCRQVRWAVGCGPEKKRR